MGPVGCCSDCVNYILAEYNRLNRPVMVNAAIFLGAGFSFVGGVPLASQLFDRRPIVDRITRRRLVDHVVTEWENWKARYHGQPEEYLRWLNAHDEHLWHDSTRFVSLAIALCMGRLEYVGAKPTVTRHNISRTTSVPAHEEFWNIVCGSRKISLNAVITTNYDILAERGLRQNPRPRVPRLGFHYSIKGERLAGRGYPTYAHIVAVSANGEVPLLKLHGSVSWSLKNGEVVHYADCRPAIRGDALIVPPTTEKEIPTLFRPMWASAARHLSNAPLWVVVGYSFPEYDEAVNELVHNTATETAIHIFDPSCTVVSRVQSLAPKAKIYHHAGLPEGLPELANLLA